MNQLNKFIIADRLPSIGDFIPNNTITFQIHGKNIIVVTPDTFTYNGDTIADVEGVYKSFVNFFNVHNNKQNP